MVVVLDFRSFATFQVSHDHMLGRRSVGDQKPILQRSDLPLQRAPVACVRHFRRFIGSAVADSPVLPSQLGAADGGIVRACGPTAAEKRQGDGTPYESSY